MDLAEKVIMISSRAVVVQASGSGLGMTPRKDLSLLKSRVGVHPLVEYPPIPYTGDGFSITTGTSGKLCVSFTDGVQEVDRWHLPPNTDLQQLLHKCEVHCKILNVGGKRGASLAGFRGYCG